MHFIADLWIPIVVSAVLCFLASAVFWMLAPHHKKDWARLPNDDGVTKALRDPAAAPGAYMVPYVGPEGMKDKDLMARHAAGPAAMMYVVSGASQQNMGPMLAKQFIYFLVVGVFTAYVGHHALADGAEYLRVFQVTGAVAFMAHGLGTIPESIWFGRPWRNWVTSAIDAFIYACLVGGSFGWRWPS